MQCMVVWPSGYIFDFFYIFTFLLSGKQVLFLEQKLAISQAEKTSYGSKVTVFV